MDQNSNLSLNLPPEVPSNYPLYPNKKPKTPKLKKWEFLVFPFLVIMIGLWYGGYLHLSAAGSPMNPNEVLDPTCAPGDTNCFVQILPSQIGNGGKYLSTNGSSTTWADIVLGFNGNRTITRPSLPAGDAATASSTDLVSFINNYFFPGTYNVPVINPTWSNTTKYIGDAVPSLPPNSGAAEYTVTDNGNTATTTTPQTVDLTSTCPNSPGYATASGTFPTTGTTVSSPIVYTRTYSFKEGFNTGGCRNAGTSGATASNVSRTLTFSWAQPTITAMSVTGGTTGPFEWGKSFAFTANVNKTITANNVTAVTLSNTAGSGAFTSISAVNMSTIGSSVTTATQSQTFTSTLTPNYSSLSGANTTYQLAASSQYLAATSPDVTNSISFTNSSFMPAVYYGLSSDNLVDASAFPDNTSTSSGSLSYKIQHLGSGSHLQNNRMVASTLFSNSSGSSQWIYFAWPAYQQPVSSFVSYEPGARSVLGNGLNTVMGANACKAIKSDSSGDNDWSPPASDCVYTCSASGCVPAPDSSFKHRSLVNFTNAQGVTIPYEIYRSYSPILDGSFAYASIQ